MGNEYTDKDKSKLVDLDFVVRLANLARSLQEVDGHQPVFLVPEGIKMLTPPREDEIPLADHIRQIVLLGDLASFNTYVKKFATDTATIFATVDDVGAEFDAVLDYHEGGRDGKPKRAQHCASYNPEYSTEYKAWRDIDGKTLSQDQFLEHLRRHGGDVTSMDDADLIELASSLDFQVAGQYSSHVERTKGGRKLLFNEVVEGSAQVKNKQIDVPDKLTLKIPIFVNGASYEISADLLYRPQGGPLKIIVELKRKHLVVRQAVKDVVAEIAAGTGIEPFLGGRQ